MSAMTETSAPLARACSVCNKAQTPTVKIQQCSRCQTRFYCGKECQKADWKRHKSVCGKTMVWYDKHRKCRDGSLHEGNLELITWECRKEGTGWGHCFIEESDDLKKRFETEYEGDESKFFKYWPQGFRWTCCGLDAGMDWGCDHHGTGAKPCTCDFCRMGKPVPDSIYKEKKASSFGLSLSRGPDRRSRSAGIGAIAALGRSMMGLDM